MEGSQRRVDGQRAAVLQPRLFWERNGDQKPFACEDLRRTPESLAPYHGATGSGAVGEGTGAAIRGIRSESVRAGI